MRVSAEPFTGFSSLVKHTHRPSLLLALLIISYKTFVAHIYKSAIAEFSNQPYPAMLQPWLCSSELFISCCGVCAFFFFFMLDLPLKSTALLQREDQSLIPASWLVCPFKNTWKQRQYAGCDLILPTPGLCVHFLFTYHILTMPARCFIYKAIQPPSFKAWMLIGANFRWAEPRHPGDANRCRNKYVSTSWF